MSHTSYTHNPKTRETASQPHQKVNVVNSVNISQDGTTDGGVTPMIGRSGSTKDVDPQLIEEFLKGTKNPVMALHEFAQRQRLKVEFKECNASQGDVVLSGMVFYTGGFGCKAIVNGVHYDPGKGKTKKLAKGEAARIALANLLGLERQDLAAPPPVRSYQQPFDPYTPSQDVEPPQAGFTSGSHFQLGFDTAAPTLTSEDVWNIPDHGTYAAYQEGQKIIPTRQQTFAPPTSTRTEDEEFTHKVPPTSTRTEDEEFIHKVPQPRTIIPPRSEEEFPSLSADNAPTVKSAWGKGPPKMNNNKPSQPSNYQQQQYPPNHQTPSEFLQHRAQTQRHAYGAIPRQPFPQQYELHGQMMTPHGMPTEGNQSPLRGPAQSPPRGPSQAMPRSPTQAVPRGPSQGASGGQTNPYYEQLGAQPTLNADWANRIREMAHNLPPTQEEAFPGSENITMNKSLAAFLVSQNGEYQLVSLGTGEGVVSPSGISIDGRSLVDSSGLTVARRSFQRYLYRELKHFLSGMPSIFIKTQSFIISLREGVQFHLYMNAAPTGDGSRFLSDEDDTELISERDLLLMTEGGHYPDMAIDSSNGCLTTLSDTGEIREVYTQPVATTFEEIKQQGSVRVMTASDKLMRWNCIGIQGALLGHIIEPLYVSTLVLGSGFNHGQLSRAVAARVDKAIFVNIANYDLNYPKIGRTSRRVPVETSNQPTLSINWSLGDRQFEVVEAGSGRIIDSSPFKSGATKASRICKAAFMSRFRGMCTKVKRPDLLEHSTYTETKLQNRNHNSAKRMLLRHLDIKGYGQWSKIPREIGSFSK